MSPPVLLHYMATSVMCHGQIYIFPMTYHITRLCKTIIIILHNNSYATLKNSILYMPNQRRCWLANVISILIQIYHELEKSTQSIKLCIIKETEVHRCNFSDPVGVHYFNIILTYCLTLYCEGNKEQEHSHELTILWNIVDKAE